MYTSIKSSDNLLSLRVVNAVSALFIFLFVYTASSKIIQLEAFKIVLAASPLLAPYARFMSLLIPFIEMIAAVLLFIPGTRQHGLILSFLLMAAFSMYVGYMLLFFSQLPCSCGGFIQSLSWRQHLILNLILTLLAGAATFHHKIFIAINRGNRKPVRE